MMIILTNTYFQYLRPGDNLLYCPIKSEEVENMIDLKEKNVLCTTKNEAAAILKEAEKQGIRTDFCKSARFSLSAVLIRPLNGLFVNVLYHFK